MKKIIYLWRIFKLMILNIYSFWFSYFCCKRLYRFALFKILTGKLKSETNPFKYYRKLFLRSFKDCFNLGRQLPVYGENGVVVEIYGRDVYNNFTGFFYNLAYLTWLFEKMKIHVEFNISHLSYDIFFENHFKDSTLKVRSCDANRFIARYMVPSEIGYKLFSKILIREKFKQQADRWISENIKGNWVAVHYRGTDIAAGKERVYKHRYHIELRPYIIYLKEVLDRRCNIFVCSDQQNFVDEMRIAFPERAYARDIQRSYDHRGLHLVPEYVGEQQKQDSLIDMLILAKATLIYTTGSGFVDVVRFLNPKTKIISLDDRRVGVGKCHYLSMPKKDFLETLFLTNK